LSPPAVTGVTADITFTNNLIGSADFAGGPTDPILQGATGRLWVSDDGRLRLELQSGNGDAQIVVDRRSFWISDPASDTVYEGTLPARGTGSGAKRAADRIPTVAEIQSDLTKLVAHLNLSGVADSDPTDVAGQAAYSVSISPKHDGGLLGSAELAWDAATGVPLDIAVYARGNSTPVLELKANDISYGPVSASVFQGVTPPAGDKVVKVATAGDHQAAIAAAKRARRSRPARVSGVASVAAHLRFHLAAPASLVGLPRRDVSLLDWGGRPAALVTYGQGLGAIVVVEQSPSAGGGSATGQSRGQGGPGGGLSLPTVSINGATAQELDTALGSVVRFTSGGVAYTVLGSVPPYAAEKAARALTQ
jgi:outer membrane lipoprotein-sorting protein